MEYKDYYQILGVSKTAGEKEIKKAYRKLARQYHPDVNPGDAAAEARFKDINEAYEVLSDPEKRQMYDKFGAQWKQYQRAGGSGADFWQQWQAQQGGRAGGYTTRTMTPEEFEQMFGGAGSGGFSSFFESLFGGRGGQGGFDFSNFTSGQRQARPQRGRDIEQPVQITLEEAFHGTTRQMKWEDGRAITAKIPRGAKTGTRVRLKGKGGSGAAGGQAGDLYLKVELLPHAQFERTGDDLKVTVPVDVYTAVLGGKAAVSTIDKTVSLTIPPGTSSGKTFRLRGLGMPNLKNPDKRGDLLATVEITVPQNLSEKEKQLFRQLQAMRSQTQ